MTITWPDVLVPKRCTPSLRNFAASGGRTVTGREQRVYSDAGFWTVRHDEIVVKDYATATAYRALLARLRQGEDVDLPIFDMHLPSDVSSGDLELSGAHALRSTTLSIASTGPTVAAGSYLSINSWLYQVTEVTSAPGGGGAGAYTVKILPPTRQAHPDTKNVKPLALVCRCVLDELNSGDLDQDLTGIAFPSLSFVEQVP